MMETPALVAAFVAMIPLMLFVMVTDLKRLKIPNIAVLLALVLFVVTGLLFCLSAIALLLVHQVVRLFTRRRETGWKAIDQTVYLPVGVALGITMLIFLGLSVADRFVAA